MDINSIIDAIGKLIANPLVVPIVLGIGIAFLSWKITGAINKFHVDVDIKFSRIEKNLNDNLNSKFEFFRDDIRRIRECNEDILIKYPVLKDLYDKRMVFEHIYKAFKKRKTDSKDSEDFHNENIDSIEEIKIKEIEKISMLD